MEKKEYKPHGTTCTCLYCEIGRISDDYDDYWFGQRYEAYAYDDNKEAKK